MKLYLILIICMFNIIISNSNSSSSKIIKQPVKYRQRVKKRNNSTRIKSINPSLRSALGAIFIPRPVCIVFQAIAKRNLSFIFFPSINISAERLFNFNACRIVITLYRCPLSHRIFSAELFISVTIPHPTILKQ